MAIKADFHMHSSFSGDSEAPMEQMIRQAIQIGLEQICFTEHLDFDYPECPDMSADMWMNDTDSYQRQICALRDKYAGQIRILFGIELGMQPHIALENQRYVQSRDFDFVIASSHVCHRQDPYYPTFYEGRTQEEAYREYFCSILENVRIFHDFDVYGHLDYVVRYGPCKDEGYSYEKYKDIIDAILALLVENGKGLEINTSGWKYGLRQPNPCADILKRYRALGGEVVTVGSDAHKPEYIGYEFARAADLLRDCGYSRYAIFAGRTAHFHPL